MSDAHGQNDGAGGPGDPRGPHEHLDILSLDALRAGEGPPEDVAHVESCNLCRRRLEGLKAIGRDLAAVASTPLSVPPESDDAILSMARRRPARRRVIPLRRLGWVAAAAATVLLAALAVWHPSGTPSRAPSMPPAADVDGSGAVDILDAFQLARAVESEAWVDKRWDLDGNGVVDTADVHALAAAAVSLKGGSTI